MKPPFIEQCHPPRQRAFHGLAGRSSADPSDCSLDELIATKAIPLAVVKEARETEKRRLAGKIDYEKDYADAAVRFQKYAFDPSISGANPIHELSNPGFEGRKSSKGKQNPSHGVDAEGQSNDAYATLFNGLNAGTAFRVFVPVTDPSHDGPRKRTPWWMLSEQIFHEFLRSLVDGKGVLKHEELLKSVGLDYTILTEFYFRRKEDQEIYFDHLKEFGLEEGRKRRTSSGNAVKMRRVRLVKVGNGEYGRSSRPVTGPEYMEYRAFWADIREGPNIHADKAEEG